MLPEIPGETGEAGQFGRWDVYPLFVQETARISDRRQTANSLYLSINSLLVGAIALLAPQSFVQTSVSLLVVQVFVAAAGYLMSRQWLRLLEKYRTLLNFRYEKLREIEGMNGFPGVLKMYQDESKQGSDKTFFGFAQVEAYIPRLFSVVYVFGALLLIADVVAIRLHFGLWLSQYINIPVLK